MSRFNLLFNEFRQKDSQPLHQQHAEWEELFVDLNYQPTVLVIVQFFSVKISSDGRNFVVFWADCFTFSMFAIIVDTTAGAKPGNYQH